MSNDGVSKVVGVGDDCLETNMEVQCLLKRVKHVLDVHSNLILMHLFDDSGHDKLFGYNKWKFSKYNFVMATMVVKEKVNVIYK